MNASFSKPIHTPTASKNAIIYILDTSSTMRHDFIDVTSNSSSDSSTYTSGKNANVQSDQYSLLSPVSNRTSPLTTVETPAKTPIHSTNNVSTTCNNNNDSATATDARTIRRRSRFDKAKEMIENSIIEQMMKSITNEIGIFLLHTETTKHHLYFSNMNSEEDEIDMGLKMDMDIDCCSNIDTQLYKKIKCEEPMDIDSIDVSNIDTSKETQQGHDEKKEGGRGEEEEDDEIPFAHITELVPLQRASVDVIRKLRSISAKPINNNDSTDTATNITALHQPPKDKTKSKITKHLGGFINGIILATDQLYTKTSKKKYNRKIILYTDGESPIDDLQYACLDIVLNSIKEMRCDLVVNGFDFDEWATISFGLYDTCKSSSTLSLIAGKDGDITKIRSSEDKTNEETSDETMMTKHSSEDEIQIAKNNHDESQTSTTMIKSENQKLLMSLLKYTSGTISSINANSIQNQSHIDSKPNFKKSTMFKAMLHIAPMNLISIPVRIATYTNKTSIPGLKREAVIYESVHNTQPCHFQQEEEQQQQQQQHEDTTTNQGSDNQNQTNNNSSNKKRIKKDVLGYDMTTKLFSATTHWDYDDPDLEVELEYQMKAYMYGSDVIPINKFDLEGLKYRVQNNSNIHSRGAQLSTCSSGSTLMKQKSLLPCASTAGAMMTKAASSSSLKNINVLGYTSLNVIPMRYWMGPLRLISGDFNKNCSFRQSHMVVASLAQALYKMQKVAVCTYTKSKNGDPVMNILAPYLEKKLHNKDECKASTQRTLSPASTSTETVEEESTIQPQNLILIEIPFADDVQLMNMNPFDDSVGNEDEIKACDDLIDKFTLPSHILQSEHIPNPSISSYFKTIIKRAIEPSNKNDFVITRENVQSQNRCDSMSTPIELVKDGKDALEKFKACFPLEVVNTENKKKKKEKTYWMNHDSQLE